MKKCKSYQGVLKFKKKIGGNHAFFFRDNQVQAGKNRDFFGKYDQVIILCARFPNIPVHVHISKYINPKTFKINSNRWHKKLI